MRIVIATSAAWLALVAGCFLTEEPDVGPLLGGPGDRVDGGVDPITSCGDSDPAASVSYAADVLPLLRRSPGGCVGCHGVAAIGGLNVTSYAGLRRGGAIAGARIVVPGRPCDSALVGKLMPIPPFGARMPYNGPPYFTRGEIIRIADWVAEGALDD